MAHDLQVDLDVLLPEVDDEREPIPHRVAHRGAGTLCWASSS